MKDSVVRIVQKGGSSILLRLAEKAARELDWQTSYGSRNHPFSMGSAGKRRLALGCAPSGSDLAECIDPSSSIEAESTLLLIEHDRSFFENRPEVEVIRMRSGVCDDPDIDCWKLHLFPALRELTVGDDCLHFVKEVKLIGLKRLEKVEIGRNCFRESEGCFEVSECGALKSVKMGKGCCVKWNSFVMKNCSIEEVSIGDGCFVNCEKTVFESLSTVEM